MVTIYDIAERTGYTAPTISKALNGTGGLSSKTRAKILETAEQMGYKPNMAARALTTKKSNLIGVIFEDSKMFQGFEHPLFGGVLNHFRKQVENAGYDIIFLSKVFNNGTMPYADHAEYRGVDGVAIINPDSDTEQLSAFRDRGIPCVSTNDFISGVCTIVSENVKAGQQAVEYLIAQGHRRIAYLAAPASETSRASSERQQGYKLALEKHGIPYDENLIEQCDYWHMQAGYKGAKNLINRDTGVTAVFAVTDLLAIGAMQYFAEMHIKVPDDISIIGFDDDRISAYIPPGLTTFRQNREVIAEIAADTLLESIAGIPSPEVIRIPAKMILRGSVKKMN